MLMIISPAKKMDYQTPLTIEKHSSAEMLDHSEDLMASLKTKTPQDICSLMGLSDKLGAMNYERFQSWQQPFDSCNARQAILAFRGDVYQGLNAQAMDIHDLEWAQDHLRILSGLYGLLRPLDLIQPYRLEMGTKYPTKRGSNLYDFWGDIITSSVNKHLTELNKRKFSPILVNLASNEYFKSVDPKRISVQILTPVFMDKKNDQYKIISFFAKRARGEMAAFVVKNRIVDGESLKEFRESGYHYNQAMSNGNKLVFTRD
ncbi:MAG: peroxide stress protein YaaA [Cellvibrionales bacterium TMED148]|nr:hypothetical protein [Porticoccaceae bacterium]RPG90062.1 MAG: peroxide stress protein YaaA [Cellvibrionales bacterium TMED148]